MSKALYQQKIDLSQYHDLDLLDMVDKYSSFHPSFKTKFTDSLKEVLDKYGVLTNSQRESLENIVLKFKMYR